MMSPMMMMMMKKAPTEVARRVFAIVQGAERDLRFFEGCFAERGGSIPDRGAASFERDRADQRADDEREREQRRARREKTPSARGGGFRPQKRRELGGHDVVRVRARRVIARGSRGGGFRFVERVLPPLATDRTRGGDACAVRECVSAWGTGNRPRGWAGGSRARVSVAIARVAGEGAKRRLRSPTGGSITSARRSFDNPWR